MSKNRDVSTELTEEDCPKCVHSWWKQIREWITRDRQIIFLVACLLVLPFALLGLIRGLDLWLPPAAYTRLPDGDGTWLSFWGSYLGCVATIILSVAAMNLSKEINTYTQHKNMADEIASFHQFHVQEMTLYDLMVDIPDEIDYFPRYNGEHIMLTVSFKSFPPYYDIDLNP